MAIGVLSIYAVLVMLFHKFIQPVTILTALPPSAAGAIVALYLCGYSLAINSLIGLLMLMGIVSKNSILIVEYAIMAQRDHGMSRFDALIDSCSKRARPIVMTTHRDGRGHDAGRLGLGRRSELPRADGCGGGRRHRRVDGDEPVHRARDVHGGRRLPAVARRASSAAAEKHAEVPAADVVHDRLAVRAVGCARLAATARRGEPRYLPDPDARLR